MSEPYDPTTPSTASYGGAQPPGDILAAGPGPERDRRKTPLIVTSIVAVIALIAGGVAFGAYQLLASHGSQPDTWAPSSSVAYVSVDLDPSAGEKVAVYNFAKHFPATPKAKDYGDLKETLFEKSFADSPFDWQSDIKPWLGDRVGVAIFSYDGKLTPIGILQHKDKAKTEAALQKAKDDGDNFGYTIEGDYAIVGPTQGAVDEAVKEAKSKSLADNGNYKSDLGALPSDRILAAWADVPSLQKALKKQLTDAFSGLEGGGFRVPDESAFSGDLGMFGALGTTSSALSQGRVAFALSVQSNYVEFQARVFDAKANPLKNGDAGKELAALPAHTMVGVSVAHPDALAKTAIEAMLKSDDSDTIRQGLSEASQETGFDLPGDIYKVLGSSLTFGLQTLPADGDAVPTMQLTTKPSDMGVAKKLVDYVTDNAPGDVPLTVKADGDALRATAGNYDTSGKLGDADRFQAAMGDVSGKVAIAGYVDLHSIWQALPTGIDLDANAKVFSAVGFVAGTDGSTPYVRLRVAVG